MGEDTGNIKVINLGFVNAYLVKAGDGFILIDTGIRQQWPRLENELMSAGCQPDNLKLVVITHGDQDHTGNCARLQQKYGAKIAIHKDDAFLANTEVKRKRTVTDPFMKLLMPLGPLLMKLNRGAAFEKFTPDMLLEDGQDFRKYGWAARVIHTPGHTSGSIVILTDDGILLAGDTLNNMRKPTTAPIVEDFEALKRSLGLIGRLDVKMVFPGHGKPFPPEVLPMFSSKP